MSGFAEVLTELMVVNEVSEAALAKAINVDISQIYKYKRGKYNPALVKAVQIADFFDCSMDFLFGLTDVQGSGSGFKKHGNFAEIFRKALLQKKCTRYRLHKDTSLALQSIDDWYNGKRLPTVSNLLILGKYLDVSIDSLLGRV